ncbi:hypothetical protein K8R14_03240 [bacterium]|nr:hypothetical protein [bacterium]
MKEDYQEELIGVKTPLNVVEIQAPGIEMESILTRIEPINGVFNPEEEMEKLRFMMSRIEDRKEVIGLFKSKLSRQREAWAVCRNTIEEQIMFKPDLSREEMVGIIGIFASNYGFPPAQIEVAESLVDEYIDVHRRVIEFREKFPKNRDLLEKLSSVRISKAEAEGVEISVGPVAIEIFCPENVFLKMGTNTTSSWDMGYATQSIARNPIPYLVLNEDSPWHEIYSMSSTLVHEREHQKNKILGPRLYSTKEIETDVLKGMEKDILGSLVMKASDKLLRSTKLLGAKETLETVALFRRYKRARDFDERSLFVKACMQRAREVALNYVKDEIIAMKAEADVSPHGGEYNIFSNQDGSFYDYLQFFREKLHKDKGDKLWQEASQRILVDEYKEIIDNSIMAFDDLKDRGYSRKEVIALLFDKRLQEWPKTAKRLLEQR